MADRWMVSREINLGWCAKCGQQAHLGWPAEWFVPSGRPVWDWLRSHLENYHGPFHNGERYIVTPAGVPKMAVAERLLGGEA